MLSTNSHFPLFPFHIPLTMYTTIHLLVFLSTTPVVVTRRHFRATLLHREYIYIYICTLSKSKVKINPQRIFYQEKQKIVKMIILIIKFFCLFKFVFMFFRKLFIIVQCNMWFSKVSFWYVYRHDNVEWENRVRKGTKSKSEKIPSKFSRTLSK